MSPMWRLGVTGTYTTMKAKAGLGGVGWDSGMTKHEGLPTPQITGKDCIRLILEVKACKELNKSASDI